MIYVEKNVIVRSNHEYDYFGNVLECEYNYFSFWTNVFEYEYNYSESTSMITISTEYDYSISEIY